MIKMEVLYPEYTNLYGDSGHIKYLKLVIPNLKVIYTRLNQKPTFTRRHIDIIYLGPSSESQQIKIIDKLKPHTEKIKELIEKNTLILATGNACEYFGKYIEKENGEIIPCLGLYKVYAKRISKQPYQENVLCPLKHFTVVGFKNQASNLHGRDKHALTIPKEKEKINFIIDKNLFATYLLGPILILNPMLTEYLLNKANIPYRPPSFEEISILAYQRRVIEFNK